MRQLRQLLPALTRPSLTDWMQLEKEEVYFARLLLSSTAVHSQL